MFQRLASIQRHASLLGRIAQGRAWWHGANKPVPCVGGHVGRVAAVAIVLAVITVVGCLPLQSETGQMGAGQSSTGQSSTGQSAKGQPAKGEAKKSQPEMGQTSSTPRADEIQFVDDVQSNVEVPKGLDGLVFLDTTGKRVPLEVYLGKKNVVLVFTEGFAGGMLCPFCKTQTSRLIANYDKFAELDTEVLVVYPGTRDHLDEFVAAAKKTDKKEVDSVPFPLVLDEDLKAVSYFNIKSNLAHPSTFIIDKQGNVRLAYVGADMSADRPSVSAMLKVVESANASQ